MHLTAAGACSWHEFTVAIMELAGLDVPVEAVATTIPPGGVDRPLNGVLARPRADALGLPAAAAVARGARGLHVRAGRRRPRLIAAQAR